MFCKNCGKKLEDGEKCSCINKIDKYGAQEKIERSIDSELDFKNKVFQNGESVEKKLKKKKINSKLVFAIVGVILVVAIASGFAINIKNEENKLSAEALDAFENGKDALKNGDYEVAQEYFRQSDSLVSNNEEAIKYIDFINLYLSFSKKMYLSKYEEALNMYDEVCSKYNNLGFKIENLENELEKHEENIKIEQIRIKILSMVNETDGIEYEGRYTFDDKVDSTGIVDMPKDLIGRNTYMFKSNAMNSPPVYFFDDNTKDLFYASQGRVVWVNQGNRDLVQEGMDAKGEIKISREDAEGIIDTIIRPNMEAYEGSNPTIITELELGMELYDYNNLIPISEGYNYFYLILVTDTRMVDVKYYINAYNGNVYSIMDGRQIY